ncbi:dnaJ homolog subfamily C member 22-like [Watersipora subatra]|uniref:dnaJ homolog subfamily C member 22-like n=1 Tax=Watersipora subatra TaxID=2589382 RepID=UPI00355BD6AB
MGTKNVTVAYILWFFFGWLGVHQFYVRRDRHAFFTWATVGGVFGISWLRDLFYIPTYVTDVNQSDDDYAKRQQEKVNAGQKPSLGFCRWAACVVLGYIFSLLPYTALWKEDLHSRYINALAVLCHILASLGVYLVSNEGHLEVSLVWCLLSSAIVLPLTLLYGHEHIFYASLASSSCANYTVKWRMRRRRSGLCKRLFCLSLIGAIYLGAVSSSVYYNATITSKGETVPLREAVENFFTSPAWKETKDTLNQLYNYYKHHGWKTIWEEIVSAIDPQGEAHAYEVLGVSDSASYADIKRAYKALALKYHPDKEKDLDKKDQMAEEFMKVQKAYDTLSKLRNTRTERSEL